MSKRAPHVRKTFDRFRVQKLANEALDTVRRQEMREHAGSQEGQALKHSRWALLKNPWKLTVRQEEKLSQLKKIFVGRASVKISHGATEQVALG